MSPVIETDFQRSVWFNHDATVRPLSKHEGSILGRQKIDEAVKAITACPRFTATPLVSLNQLAKELKFARIWLKDESGRFGLKSFKALGGAYAVLAHVAGRAGMPFSTFDPSGARERAIASEMTFCAATDGNHGRAVAAGAKLAGARCAIFVHEGVSEVRKVALMALGAEVTIVSGDYDDSVRACSTASAQNDWIKIADTAGAGEDWSTPGLVMQGYCVMVREAFDQMGADRPSHIFVQAGVGGLAAAVAATAADAGLKHSRIVIVEPARAACLLEAVRTGAPIELEGDIETNMSMLSCGRVSEPAWRILSDRVNAYLTICDEEAIAAARRLVDMEKIITTPIGISGAAGLAGLWAAGSDPELRDYLALDENSRVLLFGTEADIEADLTQKEEP